MINKFKLHKNLYDKYIILKIYVTIFLLSIVCLWFCKNSHGRNYRDESHNNLFSLRCFLGLSKTMQSSHSITPPSG